MSFCKKTIDNRQSTIVKKNGFTLVEVLVVVAILGILASFVAFSSIGHLNDARDAVRKNDLAVIRRALTYYFFDHMQYPDPGVDLEATSLEGPDWIAGLRPDYLKTIPKDPKQAGLITSLAGIFKPFFGGAGENNKGQVAAATTTLEDGIFITKGALGYEQLVSSAKYNLDYIAGVSLAQQWAKLEPTDNVFNWTFLDNSLLALKNATGGPKKANIRIHAGPSSPDWLRTSPNNVKTLCWNQSGAPMNPSWNCFPWMMNDTYRNKRKEMLEALYNHYHNEKPELEGTIAYVYVPMPNHIKAEEFVQVQNSSNTVYVDTNDASGVPIGIYCVSTFTCPTSAIQALPTSTFTGETYSNSALYTTHRNSIIDAAAAMPGWKLRVMFAGTPASPLALVQNTYNTILTNGWINKISIGFTWLGRTPDSLSDKAVWNDVKANFSDKGGSTGWEYHDSVAANQSYEAWCGDAEHGGARLRSKSLQVGGHFVPPDSEVGGAKLEAIYTTPDCELPTLPACDNHADDDGDGLMDYGGDPGCESFTDDDEYNLLLLPPACSDATDNDNDGKIDYQGGSGDPGCISDADTDETDSVPPAACSDAMDNDGDGKTDYPADPGCTDAADTSEDNLPSSSNGGYFYKYTVDSTFQNFTLSAVLEADNSQYDLNGFPGDPPVILPGE